MTFKTLFFAALLAPLGAAAALPPVPLYGPAKQEMYKYAFPEGGSSVDTQEASGNRLVVFKLKGDVWAGGGIGVDKQRLKDYVATGALEMMVRGAKGGEKLDVGFVQAKGLEANELAFQILAPLDRYVKITTQWQKVVIPLKDFPVEGTRYIDSEQRQAKGPFNWNRVLEFVVSRAPGMAGFDTVAFANVQVVGSYDASKVAAAQPQVAKPTGTVLFYGEGFASDGGGGYAYPDKQAKLEEVAGGHASKMALKATLITTAWSGGGIYRSPLDLSAFKDKGVLEVWAKGSKDGEDLYLGLVDKANGASVRLPVSQYVPGGLKADWTKVQIPLKAFPSQGSKWDEATQKNLTFDFDWTKVGEVLFDNNGPNNNNADIWLDDVAVKDAP
jgi:hypothetical protein